MRVPKQWNPESVYEAIDTGKIHTIPTKVLTAENLLKPIAKEVKDGNETYQTDHTGLELICLNVSDQDSELAGLPAAVLPLLTLDAVLAMDLKHQIFQTTKAWEKVPEIKACLAQLNQEDQTDLVEALTFYANNDPAELKLQLENLDFFIEDFKEWKKEQKVQLKAKDKPAIYGGIRFVTPRVNRLIKGIAKQLIANTGIQDLRVYIMRFNSKHYGNFNPSTLPVGSYEYPNKLFIDRSPVDLSARELNEGCLIVGNHPPDPKENAAYSASLVSLEVLSTFAHELGHAAIDRNLKKSLSPKEFSNFISNITSIDVAFRKEIIKSFAGIFRASGDYPYVEYLAGEEEAITNAYKNNIEERGATEFLAELAALVFLREVDQHNIPKECRDITHYLVRQIQEATQLFNKVLENTKPTPHEQAQKINEIIDVVKWMTNGCDPTTKPKSWMFKSATSNSIPIE
jgi:hypothetical protein